MDVECGGVDFLLGVVVYGFFVIDCEKVWCGEMCEYCVVGVE